MSRTVFFDLGNVLLFFDALKMYRQIASACSLELEEVTAIMQHQVDSYEKGWVSTQKIHQDFTRLSKKQVDFHVLREALCDIFTPNDAAIEIAKELKSKGVRLFILSNTCEAHFEFIQERFSFLNIFDGYVLSYKVGARKPEMKIFDEALSIAKCAKEHCFYTDDIPEFVRVAKSMKIDAEQFTTPDNLRAHLNQRNLL